MIANVICHGCNGHSDVGVVDATSTVQPFIWAAGPDKKISSRDSEGDINQHPDGHYGRLA